MSALGPSTGSPGKNVPFVAAAATPGRASGARTARTAMRRRMGTTRLLGTAGEAGPVAGSNQRDPGKLRIDHDAFGSCLVEERAGLRRALAGAPARLGCHGGRHSAGRHAVR